MQRKLSKSKTERDILKKRSATSHSPSSEVRLYRPVSDEMASADHIVCVARIHQVAVRNFVFRA